MLQFGAAVERSISDGNTNYLSVLDQADTFVEDPECLKTPLQSLDVVEAGITAIIRATGFALDVSWLYVDAFDDMGRPAHQRGKSTGPGVYFPGLP